VLMTRAVLIVLGVTLAAACVAFLRWGPPARSGSPSPDAVAAPVEPLPERVTFNRDVAPVVFGQCSTCHRPGESGPFPLLTYADVKKRAGQVADVTGRRFMPPWLPEAGHGRFANERRLTDRQIALIRKWADTGTQEGDAAELPPRPAFTEGWQLGEPDLVVRMPEPYTLPPDGADVYRNFVVPVPASAVTSARYVRAVEFRPGNPRVVHHAFVLTDRTGDARRRDAQDVEVGYPGMSAGDSATVPDGHFMSWQPGKVPDAGAEGLAWRLTRGSDVVLQMHMRPSGKPEPVQASVGLYFTDRPPTKFPFRLLVRSTSIDIPPGEKAYAIEDRYVLPVDVTAIGVLPHAHYLGKVLEGWATLPDGTRKSLIRIPDWDFNWQGDYRYAEPLLLPKGTAVSMRYTYDNSADNPRNPHHPPRRVTYGPETSDEMGELWLQVLPRTKEELRTLEAHYVKTWAMPDAVRRHEKSLREDPANPKTHTDLARVFAVAGKLVDAERHLRLALAHRPDYAPAHYYLGELLLQQRRGTDAREEFEAALRHDPDDFRSHNQLGVLLLDTGDPGGAAAHFERTLQLNPNDVKARINLGLVAYKKGDVARAVGYFEEALQIDPDDPTARRNLDMLRGR
jgi:Tfp pilus assembly protein PilF/mono/diheme cytochrome c family protein